MTQALSSKVDASPLVAALRAELRALVEAPVTPQNLTSIERLVGAAREVLAALEPDFVLDKRRRFNNFTSSVNPLYEGLNEDSETYGARMARELVSSLAALNKPQPPDALNVVQAIKYARENSMPDVASKLEEQLAFSVPVPASAGKKEAA